MLGACVANMVIMSSSSLTPINHLSKRLEQTNLSTGALISNVNILANCFEFLFSERRFEHSPSKSQAVIPRKH